MPRLLRALGCLLPLTLIAAAPVQTVPDRTPGENDLQRPLVVGVYDWLTILPAPQTPADFAPGSGPREQWPLRGPLTQPFGCTGFELERPVQDCPGGFHTGIDIGLPQGTPIRAAGPGLAYPFQDTERYGNHVLIQEAGGPVGHRGGHRHHPGSGRRLDALWPHGPHQRRLGPAGEGR